MEDDTTESRLTVPNTRKTLAPIQSLPIEVLSYILTLAATPSLCIFTDTNKHGLHPLAAIPSVCTTWHNLVFNNGLLWSHIDVDNTRIESDRRTYWTDRIRLWLQRSGSAPLHLHFLFEHHMRRSLAGPSVSGILIDHMSQVASLTCSGLSLFYIRTLLNLYAASCSLGHLETLSIRNIKSLPRSGGSYWPIHALQGLSVLELANLSEAVCPNLDEISSILSKSPCLHTLRLRNITVPPGQASNHPDINLPNLVFLELIPTSTKGTEQLLTTLVPGTLNLHVRLKVPYPEDQVRQSAIHTFLRRSNVVHLHLTDSHNFATRALADIFDCVPQLRSLSVDHTGQGFSPSLTALNSPVEGENARARCTNLTTLRLENVSLGARSLQDLGKILDTHPLESIIISSAYIFDDLGRDKQLLDWIRQRVENVVCEDVKVVHN